ncbi:LruC domain-containing protein [Pedobacter frigiditerrae]|uniref:LruC domain-containing protein n=1 Tax=Pedobacter frigiditerrae TaxID=2530452 RepID=A0A4R0MK80_9SPHI|nr:LruC domain-containing protein [Pedobacter frigiditerrae]TCC86602.1 LruC domain-containing protein [Pedobacter frigiditerrae]
MKYIAILAFTTLLHLASFTITLAQSAPSFGASQSFAVLGASTVTSTGPTVITGNVGVSPGTAVTGFPPATIKEGAIFGGATSLAGPAHDDAVEIFKNLSSQSVPTGNDLTGKVLGKTSGATTLKPGVYSFSSSAQLNDTLTLDDEGDPNAVFIFKIGSTLTTASYSKVVMKSGGKGPNVFWQIGSSATIGTYTTFLGNIIASASITMTTGATTTGRLFAINAAVTMDNNTAFASSLEAKDKDKDGIPDLLDDYPDDANKAFNNYSSITGGSTVAFEDLWPSKGDFDMNDLVMSYNYTIVTNANNIVVQVLGNFTLRAAGGTLSNGFAVEFPIPRASVRSLEGATLEAGQTNAVVVLFTDMQKEMPNGNTEPGKPQSNPKSYNIKFDVLKGPLFEDFGTDYNPFIFYMSATSRREVHLMDKPPSQLADQTLFGQSNDDTDVAAGRFYVTKTGLPYAISIPTSSFQYPIENKDVTQTYLHFAEWANSGGKLFIDWFSNTDNSYRNPLLIYTK